MGKRNTTYIIINITSSGYTEYIKHHLLFFLLLSLLDIHFPLLIHAHHQFVINHYTIENGLSQGTITVIEQDNTGFMWFGTMDGLHKFDGYTFTVYKNIEADPNTISDDWITSLFLDKNGTLWVGTLEGGLNKYDPKTDTFKRYPLTFYYMHTGVQQNRPEELPYSYYYLNDHSITAIYEDLNGVLWIGTFGNGLFRFDQKNETFSHRPYDFLDKNGLSYNILSIKESRDNARSILWIATLGGGLLKFEEQKGFTVYKYNPNNPESIRNNNISDICPDVIEGKAYLWVATLGSGLALFDVDNEIFTHYYHDDNNPNSIISDHIMILYKDENNLLWIGTLSSGLDTYHFQSNEFHHYNHNPANPYSLSSDEILSIFEDDSGIMWIGADFGKGINKFSKASNDFTFYTHESGQHRSLNNKVIFSICKDKDDILWIGTFKGGLNKFDRQQNNFYYYTHDPNDENSISDNHIRSITEDSRGKLWVGTFSGGLNCFDRETLTFKHYKHNPSDPFSIGANQVRCIYEDKDGILWMGTFGGGLNRFDRETQKFYKYQHDPDDPNSLSDNRIYSICEDDSGCFWIATFDGGFNKFDKKTGKFVHYKHDPYDANSLSDNRVMIVTIDPYKKYILWIGTFGGGLNKFDVTSQTITRYSEVDGLTNNVVYGILFDERGCLWLSTNSGITKFIPENELFIDYGITDGIQSNEYNAGAYFQCPKTGEMFFGGISGFNCFFPENVKMNQNIPPIVLTSFKIFGKETSSIFGPINELDHIELSYKNNFISFEFSALDYTNSSKNQFEYNLKGLNDNWIRCGTQRMVTFTNLDPGKYIFSVKGCNSDGIWNEKGKTINILINPPFWKTWWFYFISTILIISMIVLLHQYRLRINIHRSVEMERIRTAENEQVRRTVAADFHDELGQKLTRISLFSEILKRKLDNSSNENIGYVNKINNAAKELSLSTRDFIWAINPSQDSLNDVALYLKDFGDEMFDKTGINFRVEGICKTLENIKLPMKWRRHITLIFKEAMNNILKHAECTNVDFCIELNTQNFKIIIHDDGKGYSSDDISPGYGITNMKNRAQLIQSQLEINSQNGKGTSIYFTGKIPHKGYC